MRLTTTLACATVLSAGLLTTAPASADPTPGVTDLHGRVTDTAGAPVPGIAVYVYDAVDQELMDNTVTGANGVWNFDALDTDSASSYKIHVYDNNGEVFGQPAYQDLWYGGQPTFARGWVVPEPPANASTSLGDMTLPRFAGAVGTVSTPGHNLLDSPFDSVGVTAYDINDRQRDRASVNLNPADGIPDGSFFFYYLRPGQAYTFRFSGSDYDPVAKLRTELVPVFYKTGHDFSSATPVSVGAPGTVATLDHMVLTNTLVALQPPTTGPRPLVGKPLTATPGQWTLSAGAEYSYRWLRDTTVVGTGATYSPTPADLTRPLRVEVSSLVEDFTGTTSSAPTAPVQYGSNLKVNGRQAIVGGEKAAVLSIKVKVPGLRSADVRGKVVVKEKGKKVATGTMKKGKLVLTIDDPGKGKHKYVVTYLGTKTISADEAVEKITVA